MLESCTNRGPRSRQRIADTQFSDLPQKLQFATEHPASLHRPISQARRHPPRRLTVTRHNGRQGGALPSTHRTATASTQQVPAWRSLLLASPSRGGTLVAACTTRGGTSAPQPDDFLHDCNIFRTIAPDGTSPMQYLPPHTRVVGYPIGLGPYRSVAFVWTWPTVLGQEEHAW